MNDVNKLREFEAAKSGAYSYLVTVTQAAKILGVSRQRVYQLIDENRLCSGTAYDQIMVTRASVMQRISSLASHASKE